MRNKRKPRLALVLFCGLLAGCGHPQGFKVGDSVLISNERPMTVARDRGCQLQVDQSTASEFETDQTAELIAQTCELTIPARSKATVLDWRDDYPELKLDGGEFNGQRITVKRELVKAR